jgi:membrane-associated phospholipid phosphatase
VTRDEHNHSIHGALPAIWCDPNEHWKTDGVCDFVTKLAPISQFECARLLLSSDDRAGSGLSELPEQGIFSAHRIIWRCRLNATQTWFVSTVTTAIVVVASVDFLDGPIARFFYLAFGHLMIVQRFSGTPSFFGPLEVLVLTIFLMRRIAFYPLGYADAVLTLCEASLLTTRLLLAPMKFIFGRTWPLHGHPSLLIDGAYGFNFFTAGQDFHAFPSGHVASLSTLAGVLWSTYPRFRRLYAAGVAAMSMALVAGDFHFLSDVLAGVFLGITAALSILAAWDYGKRKLNFSVVQ